MDKIIRSRWLVEFERKRIEKEPTRGFVLACSDMLTLLHYMNGFYLDGYMVIRNEDVTSYRVYDKPDYFESKAIKLKKLKPIPQPEIEIGCWHEVLRSVSKVFPLITIHRELITTEVCQIGRLVSMTEKTFTLQEIDTDAKWNGNRRFRFRDVTRMDFGGSYEEVLVLVVAEDERRERTKRK